LQVTVFCPLDGTMYWIGYGSEHRHSSWFGLYSVSTRDLRIVLFRSNRIFESNRPVLRQQLFTLYTYSEYLIHRYFVFVTNENDVRTTELRTEYLFTVLYEVLCTST